MQQFHPSNTRGMIEMRCYQLKQWFYVKRPKGIVDREHYELRESDFSPQLSKNEVLIKSEYISVDPYMRIQQAATHSWEPPHPLNTVQGAAVVAKVLESNNSNFQPGDWVTGYTGWQTHAIVHGNEIQTLDPEQADVKTALGILGMPGRTAWFGLMEAGKPKPGETVLVSGAAGAVGSLVTQFAIKAGCRVVAIAGSEEKCEWLKTLGVVEALNYKAFSSAPQLQTKLLELGGIDVYFDNVGGMVSDAALTSLNLRARVVVCGQISQYNGGLDTPEMSPRFLHQLLYKRASVHGILARDFTHRMAEMIEHVAPWVKAGEIQFRTTEVNGFEYLPDTLAGLFEGQNIGKAIVRVV
ncbi:NADP-dependent oxidoreductase [Rheinheimera maricola]|uniref:NADP-dependent oxidoreductase n=1 Tax=Rheinheimera maricola TaxID=2793282 RepID=A0ABS7X7M4_9GAMM|nr:NADP-dependent oxidoreductase [Rheinheimera maricola]MBZ9610607.1 NADP-dependent oxidoreductase [Rheinheimera maricola]